MNPYEKLGIQRGNANTIRIYSEMPLSKSIWSNM